MGQWKDNRTKPVIGIAGGIGSGKSTIARMLGECGCFVIDSDAIAHQVLQSEAVKGEIRSWLGEGVFAADGSVNRKAVGHVVFADKAALAKLNGLVHPRVDERRLELMAGAFGEGRYRAIVLDTPLLFETGSERSCDVVIFVNTPLEQRLQRVREARGWSAEELRRRENSQVSLDKKQANADYIVNNTGNEAASLRQVQLVLSQILAEKP